MAKIMTANFRGGEEPEYVRALRKKISDINVQQRLLDNAAKVAIQANEKTALSKIQRKQRILDRDLTDTVKILQLYEGSV